VSKIALQNPDDHSHPSSPIKGEENFAIPSASPPLSKIPPPLWRGWEGQGEGEHEMAHEDKQGMHPFPYVGSNGTNGSPRSRHPREFLEELSESCELEEI